MVKVDIVLPPFTFDHVKNKELVIQMLKYEEILTKSPEGQALYKNPLNKPLITLNPEKQINRMVLIYFGFDPSDISVENYRTIFKTYYKSPTDYDKDVLSAVHYMRENKVVYYTQAPLKIGSQLPNCSLYTLDGTTTLDLYSIIKETPSNYTLVGAFSLS